MFNSPPLKKCLEQLLHLTPDPMGVFYGLMAGGVFWWKIGLVGALMKRESEDERDAS